MPAIAVVRCITRVARAGGDLITPNGRTVTGLRIYGNFTAITTATIHGANRNLLTF